MKTPNPTDEAALPPMDCSALKADTRARRQLARLKQHPEKYKAHLARQLEAAKRQAEREKANPELWARRIEKQRQKRKDDAYRRKMNEAEKLRQRGMPDGVVSNMMRIRLAECPPELIAIKREQMKLLRALRATKKQTTQAK